MLRNIVGGIASGDDFFDRDDLVESLWGRLPRQSVQLVAPRRFGKTSLMRRLLDQPRAGTRVFLIDCEAFGHPTIFVDALYETLQQDDRAARTRRGFGKALGGAAGFLRRVKKIGFGLEGVTLDLADSRDPAWGTSIKTLVEAARARTVTTVIIVDEFSMMLDNFVKSGLDTVLIVNFLAWFRRLRQEQGGAPCLTFLVGGSISLEYWLRRLNASAQMNDVHPEEVPPFDHDTAVEFVQALAGSQRLKLDQAARDAILQRVNPAVPFWIQALMLALEQQCGRERLIMPSDVVAAYQDRLIGRAGRQFFQPFEERLSRENPVLRRGALSVLTSLAAAPPERGVERRTLALIFASATGNHAPEDFDAVFADLQSDFYIRYDAASERCFFAHSVLRDWWLRWHPTAAAEQWEAGDDAT